MKQPSPADSHTEGPTVHRPRRPACPRCDGLTERIPRRTLDFVISLALPVRRYRCLAIGCRWEGILFKPRAARAHDLRGNALGGRRPYL
jgi:hypothetical protein